MIFTKPLEEITFEDLQGLIGRQESQEIEFKRDLYGRNDEEVRELLRDITSFANASGGYIIIGMETDDDERAVNLIGVENGEEENQRIMQSCLSNIDERILGLKTRAISTHAGKHSIIINVPRSTLAPHIITFKGLNQFWKRYGKTKNKMSTAEIKEACLKTMALQKSLEDFLKERREKILRSTKGLPFYYISTTPLIVKDEVLDIFDQGIRALLTGTPPYFRGSGSWNIGLWQEIHPSLYGIVAEDKRKNIQLEVFRNAHVELLVRIDTPSFCRYTHKIEGEEKPVMYPYPLCEYPVSFLHLIRSLYRQISILEPIIVQVALYNIRNFGLGRVPSIEQDSTPRSWSEEHLELPPRQFSVPFEPGIISKTLADRIWNAFGFERAPLFDNQGRFTP